MLIAIAATNTVSEAKARHGRNRCWGTNTAASPIEAE